jgi:hypothetical protein
LERDTAGRKRRMEARSRCANLGGAAQRGVVQARLRSCMVVSNWLAGVCAFDVASRVHAVNCSVLQGGRSGVSAQDGALVVCPLCLRRRQMCARREASGAAVASEAEAMAGRRQAGQGGCLQ